MQTETRNPSQVTVKTVLTVCFTVLGVLALVWVVRHAKIALVLVLISALLAVALDHGVEWLARRWMSRRLAVGVIFTTLLLALVGLGLLFIPPLVNQAQELVRSAPEIAAQVRDSQVYRWVDEQVGVGQLTDRAKQAATGAGGGTAVDTAVKAVSGVVATVAGFVTVLFLILFMLLFGGRLVHALVQETAPERRDRYARVLRNVYDAVGGYLSGLAVICGVNATCTTILLAVIGVPFFLPLGILSGLSSLVPLVGNTVAGVLISLVALATGGLWKGVLMGAFFIVYQQFENHVLGPMVYRRSVDLNPLVVVLGLLIFAELWSVPGAVLAVPVIAVGQIVLREVLAMRREQLDLPKPTPPPEDGRVELEEESPPLHS